MTPKRVILRAELTPQAKHGLERICDRRGMTQVSVMSRLILWFASQDSRAQQAILNGGADDPARMLFEELVRRIEHAAKAK